MAAGTLTLGSPEGGRDWQMVVVYRGLHCPLCKKYLGKLEELQDRFHGLGVDVVAVSGDPEEPRPVPFADETGPHGAGGLRADASSRCRRCGVYVSDPRDARRRPTSPFPEPGRLRHQRRGPVCTSADISNAPFARPGPRVPGRRARVHPRQRLPDPRHAGPPDREPHAASGAETLPTERQNC